MELLERDDVLKRLLLQLDGVRRGDGGLALVRGEAGIGKTAVATYLSQVATRHARVLWGWCDDLLAARPLGPLWDMASAAPDLDEALRTDDQHLLRQAVIHVFTKSRRPTVAVFEDVHWADGATLDLLTLVGRRVAESFTLVVLTFREVEADHPLSSVLGSLPAAKVESIRLRPLSRSAVGTLAQGKADASAVFARTGGNPFLVSELLSSPEDSVPATVSDLMGSQLTRLSCKARHLVELVSVVPGETELSLLHTVDADLMSSFSEAERLALLQMGDLTVSFRHELARSAVLNALPAPHRRDLHLQVLRAGEELGLDPARLAHHARRAQDPDAMARVLPEAAQQAAAGHSHREAVSHLEALRPHLHLLPRARQADLLELWADEEEFVSGNGLPRAMAALDLRKQLGDVADVGSGLIRASRAAWSGGDFAQAARLADEAAVALQGVGGENLALAYAQLARWAIQRLDLGLAMRYSEQALAIAVDASQARALALTTWGVCQNLRSYPAGCPTLLEAAGVAAALGLAWEQHRAKTNLIETALMAKDLDKARRLNEGVLCVVDDDMAVWHLMMRALVQTAAGEYASASAVLEDLLQRDDLLPSVRWFSQAARAELWVRQGSPGAGQAVHQLWDRATSIGQFQDRVRASTLSAEYLWAFQKRDDRVTSRNLEVFEEVAATSVEWIVGEHALWLWLDGHLDAIPSQAPEPLRWLCEDRWQRSADWFAERGLPLQQAVALSLGDTEARLDALRIALHIGAAPLAARFRHALHADGVHSIPRGPRRASVESPLGLTPRQAQVLALLAEGLSNAEIASRLFLSLRTVENHVSAILTKLGVTSRDEAVHASSAGSAPRS